MTDITMIEALWVTGVSMGVVFGTLVIISLVLDLQKLIFYKKPMKNQHVTVESNRRMGDLKVMTEDELLIAMASAIHFSTKPDAKIRIKAIKRLS